jgi:hypothetical protein
MDTERKQQIADIFTNLNEYEETSQENWRYNCIAWALYDTRQWWWPTGRGSGNFWLAQVPYDNKLETVVKLFEMHGYVKCDNETQEAGYEKVAIYQHSQFDVQHAARQLQNGKWTSKLGEWEDISHNTPRCLECADYGTVVQILKRRREEWDQHGFNVTA